MKLFNRGGAVSASDSPAGKVLVPQETALPVKVDPAPVPHREIGPAIGTGNEAQVDRRNMIADAVDEARVAEGLEIDSGEPVVKEKPKAAPVEAAPEAEAEAEPAEEQETKPEPIV